MSPTTFAKLIESGVLEIGDGYRAKNSELGGEGPIFLRAGHVSDTHIDFVGAERFLAELADRVRSKMSEVGDTIITTKGNSTGRTSFVTPSMPPFIYSPHLSYWRSKDAESLDPNFIRYWSRSPEFIRQLNGMKVSTDMAPYLSLTDQRRLEITLPAIEVQRHSGALLSSLDDKIETNRRMNAGLEEMARAIFRAWFVDFEPVKARAAGATSFPGMPQETFDQLPNRLTPSELGEIPEGWEVKPVGDVLETVGGGTPSTKQPEFWEGGSHCFCTPKDMSKLESPILTDTDRKITEAGVEKISSGVLPAQTVVMSSRAPIGYLAICKVPTAVNQGIIAMKPGSVPAPFVLFWAEQHMDMIEANASGSTFAEISKKNFRPISMVLPDSQTLAAFDCTASALFDQITTNLFENYEIASTRDALLPRLISGDLPIPAPEGGSDG